MDTWYLASIIVLFAASLQAATGFGFSVMATPFLLLVFDAHTAIQINIILSLLISLIMVPRIGHTINKPLLARMLKGCLVGAPLGLLVFLYLDPYYLTLIISLLILFLTALLLFKIRTQQSVIKDHAAGGISGILTTSLGMPGPPLLLYFSGTQMDKAALRSTTLAFGLFVYAASLLLQVASGSTRLDIWLTAVSLAPVAIIGIIIGQYLFRYISQAIFTLITYLILGITGTHLLLSTL